MTMGSRIPPRVARQALQWLVTLQSEVVTAEQQERWRHWRSAHPDHESAWQRIEQMNGRLREVASPLAHAAIASNEPRPKRRTLKALAALFVIGAIVVAAIPQSRVQTADYQTGAGEQREILLPDGTQVALNTDTAIVMRIDESIREITLLRGEILLETGHDTPLSQINLQVATAAGGVEALGTRFGVRDTVGSVRVHVFDGAVQLRSANRPQAVQRLDPGQAAQLYDDRIDVLDSHNAGASGRGDQMVVARNMRLADFVVELNRHFFGRLECDPAVADLRVSGTYPLDDIDRIVDVLTNTLPVEKRSQTRYWVQLTPGNR